VRDLFGAENAYKEWRLAGPLREVLYREIVGRREQDDASVPYFKDGTGITRASRRQRLPDLSAPQITLEAPRKSSSTATSARRAPRGGHEFYQLGAAEVSPNGEWLAFCEDFVGRRSTSCASVSCACTRCSRIPFERRIRPRRGANDNANRL